MSKRSASTISSSPPVAARRGRPPKNIAALSDDVSPSISDCSDYSSSSSAGKESVTDDIISQKFPKFTTDRKRHLVYESESSEDSFEETANPVNTVITDYEEEEEEELFTDACFVEMHEKITTEKIMNDISFGEDPMDAISMLWSDAESFESSFSDDEDMNQAILNDIKENQTTNSKHDSRRIAHSMNNNVIASPPQPQFNKSMSQTQLELPMAKRFKSELDKSDMLMYAHTPIGKENIGDSNNSQSTSLSGNPLQIQNGSNAGTKNFLAGLTKETMMATLSQLPSVNIASLTNAAKKEMEIKKPQLFKQLPNRPLTRMESIELIYQMIMADKESQKQLLQNPYNKKKKPMSPNKNKKPVTPKVSTAPPPPPADNNPLPSELSTLCKGTKLVSSTTNDLDLRLSIENALLQSSDDEDDVDDMEEPVLNIEEFEYLNHSLVDQSQCDVENSESFERWGKIPIGAFRRSRRRSAPYLLLSRALKSSVLHQTVGTTKLSESKPKPSVIHSMLTPTVSQGFDFPESPTLTPISNPSSNIQKSSLFSPDFFKDDNFLSHELPDTFPSLSLTPPMFQ
ncbi:hypothetical protein ROZALSC1DRAFT_26978 [Rozella allomycis CSF55]|uniref:Uncharacterized protein n=1 Tax=Rozella allomycis (strain CSF55) TaxID=988480 RepID=A0A4P9YSB0_ROZAC|nr:hypothetical protein ROZALSC1DRAFT_26978 [Rozella allomycis CSF55]